MRVIYSAGDCFDVTGSIAFRGPCEAEAEIEALFAKNPNVHSVIVLKDADGRKNIGNVWQRIPTTPPSAPAAGEGNHAGEGKS